MHTWKTVKLKSPQWEGQVCAITATATAASAAATAATTAAAAAVAWHEALQAREVQVRYVQEHRAVVGEGDAGHAGSQVQGHSGRERHPEPAGEGRPVEEQGHAQGDADIQVGGQLHVLLKEGAGAGVRVCEEWVVVVVGGGGGRREIEVLCPIHHIMGVRAGG